MALTPNPLGSESILCLETSSPDSGSWAWASGGSVRQSATFSGRTSSALAASLAKDLPTLPSDAPINRIFVGVGPGSFSGIRAAIALAQGLALGWNAQVEAVRSSNGVAFQHRNTTFLGVFSDARRNQLFVTCYERGQLSRPSQVIAREDLEIWLGKCTLAVSSDGFSSDLLHTVPTATDILLHLFEHGLKDNLPLEPIHLRPPLTTSA